MTKRKQDERIKALENEVAMLKARLAVLEQRPVHPQAPEPYRPYTPHTPPYPWPWGQVWCGSTGGTQ